MTEREPAPPSSWDLAPISDALAANGEHRTDPELGDVLHLQLPHSLEIDLYPATGLVHLTTPDSHIALGHQQAPTIDDFGIVFSKQSDQLHTDLTVDRDGAVTLLFTPASHEDANQTEKRPLETSESANRPKHT